METLHQLGKRLGVHLHDWEWIGKGCWKCGLCEELTRGDVYYVPCSRCGKTYDGEDVCSMCAEVLTGQKTN